MQCRDVFAVQRIFVVLAVVTLSGCKQDRGGDHVPEFKTYNVTALPAGASKTGIRYTTVDSDYLREVVHLGEIFTLCVDGSFSETQLSDINELLTRETSSVTTSGLQTVLNHALKNASKFSSKYKSTQPRIEFQITNVEIAETCHLLMSTATRDQFPFTESDFDKDDAPLFYPGQLKDKAGAKNATSIGYLRSTSTSQTPILFQRLVSHYLGLEESKLEHSFLNPLTTDTSDAKWFVTYTKEKDHSTDAMTVYAYAAIYADVLKPTDLETFQHFHDQPSGESSDSALTIESQGEPHEFAKAIGKRSIYGARKAASAVRTCFQISSGIDLGDTEVSSMIAFSKANAADHIGGLVAAENGKMNTELTRVTENCELLVAIRNGTEYPFVDYALNGAYFREGTVKDSIGEVVKIPIIYLNASNLSFDSQESDKKFAGYVLEHEFAHYLGFRHQSHDGSIMSPGGYYSQWLDSDRAAVKEFCQQHQILHGEL